MGGRWPYSFCFVGCYLQDLFNIDRSILVYLLSSFFSIHVVHPYSSIDTIAACKKLSLILSVRSDYHMADSLLIAVYAFVSHVSMSVSVSKMYFSLLRNSLWSLNVLCLLSVIILLSVKIKRWPSIYANYVIFAKLRFERKKKLISLISSKENRFRFFFCFVLFFVVFLFVCFFFCSVFLFFLFCFFFLLACLFKETVLKEITLICKEYDNKKKQKQINLFNHYYNFDSRQLSNLEENNLSGSSRLKKFFFLP